MSKKKDLAKLALTGLLLAAQTPAFVQAGEIHSSEVFLAFAGCPAHGCPGKKPPKKTDKENEEKGNLVADAAGDFARPGSGSYQAGSYSSPNPNYGTMSVGGSYGTSTNAGGGYSANSQYYSGSSSVGGSYGTTEIGPGRASEAGTWQGSSRVTGTNPNLNQMESANYRSFNTNTGSQTSPAYQGHYLDSRYYSETVAPYGAPQTGVYGYGYSSSNPADGYDSTHFGPSTGYGNGQGSYTSNQGYNSQGYGGPSTGGGYESVTTPGIISEPRLLSQLSPASREIYLSLDPEGKALALQLGSMVNYTDKDLAVREAQKRMNERRALLQSKQ